MQTQNSQGANGAHSGVVLMADGTEVGHSDRERLAVLETLVSGIHDRMSSIAAEDSRAHAAIEAQLKDMNRPTSKLHLVGVLFGVVVFVAGMVWAASRYPERSEFGLLQRQIEEVTINQRLVMHDLTDVRERLKNIESHK